MPAGPFAELGRILYGSDDQSFSQTLQRVAETTRQVLPELDEVSVTLIEGGRARTVVFTGPLASFLDERQYEQGFGPCMDAALSGGTITVNTADPGSVYPDFARVAAHRGVTRVLSVGLPIPQRTVGALNMYSSTRQPFMDESVVLAEAFAGYAAVAVANATLHQAAVDQALHMQAAMRTRSTIEQAKGILISRRYCTPEEAFNLLVQASQRRNRKLHDIAIELVSRAQDPTANRELGDGRW